MDIRDPRAIAEMIISETAKLTIDGYGFVRASHAKILALAFIRMQEREGEEMTPGDLGMMELPPKEYLGEKEPTYRIMADCRRLPKQMLARDLGCNLVYSYRDDAHPEIVMIDAVQVAECYRSMCSSRSACARHAKCWGFQKPLYVNEVVR